MTTATTTAPWLNRARSRLYTVAHDEYLDGSIDATRVEALLDQIGAPQAQHTQIIAMWNAEQDVARLELTPAQIRSAFKRDLFDAATAVAELVERGMTTEDAKLFLKSVQLRDAQIAAVDAVPG